MLKNRQDFAKAFDIYVVVLGVLSIGYYLTCGIVAGFSVNVLFIWLIGGLMLTVYGVAAMILRRNGVAVRIFRIATACLVGAVQLVFLVVGGFVVSKIGSKAPEDVDALIVLGAKVNGTEPSYALEERIVSAADYLLENPGTICVATGGHGSGEISEAECIARGLERRGIDRSRVIIEDKSTDTAQNIGYALSLLSEKYDDVKTIAVVTNNFHVCRAMLVTEKLSKAVGEFGIYGEAADYDSILFWHYFIRECFGVVCEKIRGTA